MTFREVHFPSTPVAYIPAELPLHFPLESELEPDKKHFLISIPWRESYLSWVPVEYRDFFVHVFPYLHQRTTNVHTARCLSFLEEFVAAHAPQKVNRRVLACALILHDCGWSQMSEAEIADSLGVTGLQLPPHALRPKAKHAIVGEKLARRLLAKFAFSPQLSRAEQRLILDGVLWHDKPEEVAAMSEDIPLEIKLLVDLDHLWSFTTENFWQDTVRKGIRPSTYLRNLSSDLDEYFVTHYGRKKAYLMLQQRSKEVEALEQWLEQRDFN